MAANHPSTRSEAQKRDASAIYHDLSMRLSHAKALCETIGAASAASQRGILVSDGTIDIACHAVADMLEGMQESANQLYQVGRG